MGVSTCFIIILSGCSWVFDGWAESLISDNSVKMTGKVSSIKT